MLFAVSLLRSVVVDQGQYEASTVCDRQVGKWQLDQKITSLSPGQGNLNTGIFILFFITSDPNLTQTQTLTLKITPNLTLSLILTLRKANEKSMNEHFSFLFYSL